MPLGRERMVVGNPCHPGASKIVRDGDVLLLTIGQLLACGGAASTSL